tara:strand:- start:821 stop:955 length:135 start_codon:yes stop_codon:yes gene_type:complete
MTKSKLNQLIQKWMREKEAIKELILLDSIQAEIDKIKKETSKRV